VKLICSRLGLNVAGELDLTPALIKGRSCYVTVETEEYEDQEGNPKKRNVVPFAGYDRADAAPQAAAPKAEKTGGTEDDSEEDLPF
jgi:single-stranded DNA-binding protein